MCAVPSGLTVMTQDRVPVFLLSGFLGAGKSTLLNALLTDPAFHDSAVIINEFGEEPIDHLLMREGRTSINQVSTGCLCCSGDTDLRSTLFDLHCAASGGLCPPFSRVIVETSGLGDPAPLVNALLGPDDAPGSLRDTTLADSFYLAGFVTLFDIITGAMSVERHFEALKQIAFADRIVLTKTDLARDPATLADLAALPAELRVLNASAEIIDRREADLPALFSPRTYSVAGQGEDVTGWLALEAALAVETHSGNTGSQIDTTRHGPGIKTFCIVSDTPTTTARLETFLAALQDAAGPQLLRVKGIVATTDDPDRPLVIHAVQHVASPSVRLNAWPDDDRRTRLVFIASGIDPGPVRALFTAALDGAPGPAGKIMRHIANARDRLVDRVRNRFSERLHSRFGQARD